MEEYPHKTPSGVIKDVNFIYKPVPDDQAGTGRRLGSIHSASSCEVGVLKWQCCALVDNNGYYTACAVDGKRAINVVTWCAARVASVNQKLAPMKLYKQRVLMHGHQGWNVRHGLCHIYMIYVYIWVVDSFCLFCCLFIIVTTQFVALYEPCKPKPKPKPSTYDTRTTTPWQRSKFRYLDRSQSNKYAINMQIQTISVSK